MSDEAFERRARELLHALNLWSARADTYDDNLESRHDVEALVQAFREVRREALEEAAKLCESKALQYDRHTPNPYSAGALRSIAERIRALLPATKEGPK